MALRNEIALARMVPTEDGGLTITIDRAPGPSVMRFLVGLEQEHGIAVMSASLDREPGPDGVGLDPAAAGGRGMMWARAGLVLGFLLVWLIGLMPLKAVVLLAGPAGYSDVYGTVWDGRIYDLRLQGQDCAGGPGPVAARGAPDRTAEPGLADRG